MFRRGKRGQITVFVLLAIVILFAFMFLLFMKVFIEKNKYQVMATQQVQDYISQNSLSIYVTSCIDSVTTEAVIRASLQGGMFNFTGKIPGKDYVTYFNPEYNRTVNISIAVTPNDNCSVVRNSPWEYPYPNKFLYPAYKLQLIYDNDTFSCKYSGDIYDYYSGFFGRNQLLKLCDLNGSNKIWATTTEYGARTCEDGTYNDRRVTSVQQEMQYFIEQEIQNCIDFNEVLQRSPSNITQAGDPRAFITFGDDGFNVKVQYPFTVTVRGRQPITAFYDFGIDKPIRFKEVYDYAYFSIRSDVQEAAFNMLEDKTVNPDLAGVYRNYDIQRIKSITPAQIDIIRIVDEGTRIDGTPLIIQFAIKNRRPALDYINAYSGFLGVDLVIQENDSVIITPKGYDPDEDELIYGYGLWKEDYDEVYSTTPECNPPANLEFMREHCMIRVNSQPKNFTNSTEFQVSKQNARYFPNSSDRGYHELNVSIRENGRQNLTDWQIVKIFVFDKPTANISIIRQYSDINDTFASIEDPYVLSGVNSLVGLSGTLSEISNDFSSFVWSDSKGNFNKYIEIKSDLNKTLHLPLDVNGTGSDLPSAIRPYAFATTGWRNISLIVNTVLGLSATAEFEVKVRQCLPHRNPTNPSYPYNSLPYDINDAYQADHTCCAADTYIVNGSNSVCYNSVKYGSNNSFNNLQNNYWTKQPAPPSPIYLYFSGYPTPPQRADNDIWMQTFTRWCSGISGNTCTGIAREDRVDVQRCDDTNYNSPVQFRDERCQGPPPASMANPSISPLQCYNYTPGQTFESLAGLGGNGECTTSPQCANPTYSTNPFGSVNQRYTCEGRCGGDGKCSRATIVTCKCDANCSTPIQSSGACNGISYQFNYGSGPTRDGVIYCTGGNPSIDNPLYQNGCSNCGLVDTTPRVCRTPGPGRVGCSAPDVGCDGITVGGAVQTNNYQFCNNQCISQDCLGNFAFNGVSCENSCTDDSQCRDGFTCCTSGMIANHQCANLGSCINYVPVVP